MELDEAIRRRRMCRATPTAPVPRELVEGLLDRARRAPSAGHSQGWAFLALTDSARFWDVASSAEWRRSDEAERLMRAPVVVVPLCSAEVYVARYSEPDKVAAGLTTEEAWAVPFWTVDVSFATMLLLLGAVEEGLGALFFGFRNREAIDSFRSEFAVPASWSPIGAVAVGWPSDPDFGPSGSAWRGRRSVADVAHWDGW